MKLYLTPGTCSLSPHIALLEAGLPFDEELVDLRTKRTKSGADFNTINPKGYVPVLQLDSGDILTEGAAIVQYVADRKPETHLAPSAGTAERYHLMEWLNFVASEIHKGFSPLFNQSMPEEGKQIARDRLFKRFDFLDGHFAGKPYLMGDTYTVADCYLYAILRWTKNVHIDLTKWATLTKYFNGIGARPAVQAALKAEGLPA